MDNITTSNDAIFDFAPYIIVLCIILTVFIAVFDLLWKKRKINRLLRLHVKMTIILLIIKIFIRI